MIIESLAELRDSKVLWYIFDFRRLAILCIPKMLITYELIWIIRCLFTQVPFVRSFLLSLSCTIFSEVQIRVSLCIHPQFDQGQWLDLGFSQFPDKGLSEKSVSQSKNIRYDWGAFHILEYFIYSIAVLNFFLNWFVVDWLHKYKQNINEHNSLE